MKLSSDSLARVGRLTLIALAGLLSVLSIVACASRHAGHQEISALIDRYRGADKPEPGKAGTSKPSGQARSLQDEQLERVVRRNVFSPPAVKKFSAALIGVLGDEALFSGNECVKVGQAISGATLKQIGPDWVEVEYEGTLKKLYVFGPGGAPSAPASPSGPPGPAGVAGGMAVMPAEAGRPATPPDFQMTPEMMERLRSMPPEVREKVLSRMPPETREKVQQGL
jgi:hypothetical protein